MKNILKRLSTLPVVKSMGRVLFLLFKRLLLTISIPIILIDSFLALIILLRDWANKHNKELNV